MQYREDKRSGNRLSTLGFGCMRFPMRLGTIDKQATELLILEAIEAGVNYFDTAYLYPGSEAVLGEILERDNLRDLVYIATKLPHGKVQRPENLDQLFATSLDRLRADHVDYYLIHNIATAEQWERLVSLGVEEWIARKKAEGALRQIGFSFHGTLTEFKKVLDAYDWDFTQIQYNYVNEHYQAGREGLRLAAEKNMPVVIMEPLLGGRLADKLPEDAAKVLHDADPALGNAGWALRWLYDQPQVTVVLSGMNAHEQLVENCAAASATLPGSMSEADHAVIEHARELFRASYRVPCTGCNYCLPCPQGISIPALFASYNESFAIDRLTGLMQYVTSAGAPSPTARLASDCVKCGACAKKCPQHIDIPAELENVCKRLQPPGLRAGLQLYARIAR